MQEERMAKRYKARQLRNKIIGIVIAVILVAAIGGGLWYLIATQDNGQDEERTVVAHGYEGPESSYILENDNLKFELDWETTQFTVTDKKTGTQWFSNPQDIESDSISLPAEKEKLNSTLLLTYSTKNGVDTLFNNYFYSIVNKTYEIEQGSDYIKVMYSIGKVEKEYVIPNVITDANMIALMDKLSKSEAAKIKDYYKKYDINNPGKKDNVDELKERYPIYETEPIWAIRDTTKENMKRKLEEYFANAGYTVEDWERDKALDTTVTVTDKPVFNINIVYRLDGEDLLVELPLNEMEYKEIYPIYSVSVLPYFGAGSKNDTGYMVVPEGGGAVIDFNNGKVTQQPYYSNMYGWDMAQERKTLVTETRVGFNAFGISRNGKSLLCVIESGAPYAAIEAEIAGKNHGFNQVDAKYNVLHRNQYDVGGRTTAAMFVYEDAMPDESIVQRYKFVDSDSYVDMAHAYGDYIRTKYEGYFDKNTDAEAPVVVEILGAVDKIKQICGIPVLRPLKLTTYKEAQNMVADLYENGFENMSVKLTGWANGGVQQKVLTKIKTVSELGSKKDLKNMIDETAKLGVTVYLDGVTNYAYNSDLFDGYSYYQDTAKYVSKERVELYDYSTVSYQQLKANDEYYLLKASMVWDMADNLVDTASKYNAGVSFRDYGYVLSADYNKDDLVSRQASMLHQKEQLKGYVDASKKIMINSGNDYAVPYADVITNMDFSGMAYSIIDRTIPFYQIAIHGYVNYTGESLNLAQNCNDELLRSAEYGAGLSFTFMDETAFALQSTLYTQYFGADYESWHDEAVKIYNRYNNELGGIFNQTIVDHKYETATLTCTTYEDNTKVYVNYGYEDVTAADGTKVPARDYTVSK